MAEAFDEQYRGYKLKCQPQMSDDGRFLAFLVISHGFDPAQIDKAAMLDLPSFSRKEEAALASRLAGTRWVDEALSYKASPWSGKPFRKTEPVSLEHTLQGAAATG
jgi:hypothetical protein